MALIALPQSSSESTLTQTPQALAANGAYEFKLLSHRISAGFPSPAADYAEEGLDLNHYLVQNKPATFMFTVKGDSMMGAGICDGDKVVVDKALKPNSSQRTQITIPLPLMRTANSRSGV
jgi:DNA polymerase V